jgi:Origin of replication binding protein/Primase C terminal 2 (PriCT-2)
MKLNFEATELDDLYSFMNNYRNYPQQKEKLSWTNLMTDKPFGSYNIPDADYDKFLKLYGNAIIAGYSPHITEKHKEYGPIVIDLDFKQKKEDNKRFYTEEIIKNIVAIYNKIIIKYLNVTSIHLCAYVMEKKTLALKKDGWGDGLHIIYPDICTKPSLQMVIREDVIKEFREKNIFSKIPLINSLEAVVDQCAIYQTGWLLYGSRKTISSPSYELTHIYCMANNKMFNSLIPGENINSEKWIRDLVKELSIRKFKDHEITLLANGIPPGDIDVWINNTKKMNSMLVPQKKADQKFIAMTEHLEYDEQIIIRLLDMLKQERMEQYCYWYRIIKILNHCFMTDKNKIIDFKSIAHQWSKNSNYDKEFLNKLWDSLESKKKKSYTISTLHYYAKIDNPEEYHKLRIYMYLRMRKNIFPINDIIISRVIAKKDVCCVELSDEYCPFIKGKHETAKTIYFEVTKTDIIMKCKECFGENITAFISTYALINIFGLDVPEENQNKKTLTITNSDDILLMNELKYEFTKICEKTKYISDEKIEQMKLNDTIIIFSPTGTGKTTTINKLLEEYTLQTEQVKILSVVSRRSMAVLHKELFESMHMTSYLDSEGTKDRFIVSLEQLYKVDSNYDILILDEITSLLLHFYSPTMKKFRLKSFAKLMDLMHNCKKIIMCDAIITDIVLTYVSKLRDGKIIYYRNKYQNKTGVKLNIYYRTNNPIKKELEIFCKPIIKMVKNNESVIIICDSKSITNNIYNYLLQFNESKKYFKIFTKDSGSLKELEDCNTKWKNKCVLFSPKIIYGIDVIIPYDNIYAVYNGNTIDSFSMLQQVSRSRNTKAVNVLFLLKHYQETMNNYISYSTNKYIEELELQRFDTKNIDKIKDHILYELESITFNDKTSDMLHEINENSLFGQIHLYASWYRRLFNYNKGQLFEQLCREQGYDITKIVFDLDDEPSSFVNIKKKIVEEIMDQTEKIITNDNKNGDDLINVANRKEIINESLKSRKKILNVTDIDLMNDAKLREIVKDEDRFNKCVKSIMLYYSKEIIDKKELDEYANNFSFIEKSKRLFKLLSIIEWLEDELGVSRFNIIELEIENTEQLIKKMKKQIDMFQYLSISTSRPNRIDEILSRINKLQSDDKVKKFFMEIINQFDKFYNWKSKRIGKKRILTYVDFEFNNNIVIDHSKIINCLNMDPNKFNTAIKNKIIKKDLV